MPACRMAGRAGPAAARMPPGYLSRSSGRRQAGVGHHACQDEEKAEEETAEWAGLPEGDDGDGLMSGERGQRALAGRRHFEVGVRHHQASLPSRTVQDGLDPLFHDDRDAGLRLDPERVASLERAVRHDIARGAGQAEQRRRHAGHLLDHGRRDVLSEPVGEQALGAGGAGVDGGPGSLGIQVEDLVRGLAGPDRPFHCPDAVLADLGVIVD